jgi:hypothetical protein
MNRSGLLTDLPGQLGSRTDPKLAEDVPEMELDGLIGYEDLGSDSSIRSALSDQLGDPPLDCRQLVSRRGAAADPREFGARFLRPKPRSQLLKHSQRLSQPLPRRTLAFGSSFDRAQRKKRPAPIERDRCPLVGGQRFRETCAGAIEVAPGGAEEAPAPLSGGYRRESIEPAGPRRESLQ